MSRPSEDTYQPSDFAHFVELSEESHLELAVCVIVSFE
jgi:hypothetical protein